MIIEYINIISPYISILVKLMLVVSIPLLIMKILVKAILKYDDPTIVERTPLRLVAIIIRYVTFILIFILILGVFGIDLKSLILSFGLVGVAVSLAAKDTFSNIISGIVLIIEKKFSVGDLIEIDGQMGKVVKIGLRSVELYYKTKYISVPNVIFSTKSLVNYTKYEVYPETFVINISNDYNLEDKINELQKVLDKTDLILKEPSYLILPKAITPYGVDVTIKFYIKNPQKNNRIKAKLIRQIKKEVEIKNADLHDEKCFED